MSSLRYRQERFFLACREARNTLYATLIHIDSFHRLKDATEVPVDVAASFVANIVPTASNAPQTKLPFIYQLFRA